MRTADNHYPLVSPISIPGQTPEYKGALPEPTYALCGDKGIYMAVGYPENYLLYRGTYDSNKNIGSWSWSCYGEWN